MLKDLNDLQTEVLVRGNYSTTLAFITQTQLNDWINMSHQWAAAYRKWPFTEKRDISANTSDADEIHNYPSDFKSDSIRILTVNSKRLRKTNFDDYLRYREENSSGTDRIFADFNRTYYINPNIDISGTIHAYGQYKVSDLDVTDLTATTVFSGSEEDGNEAIVEKVLANAKQREGKMQESQLHLQTATELLKGVWERISGEQFGYHPKGEGMWERLDVVDGDYHNELFKRDRFT